MKTVDQSYRVFVDYDDDQQFDNNPRSVTSAIEFAEEVAYEVRAPVEVRKIDRKKVFARFEPTDSIVRTI